MMAGWFSWSIFLSHVSPQSLLEFYHLRFEEVTQVISGDSFASRPSIVLLGPSDIALNVSPRQISERVPTTQIYNLGVVMAGPDLLHDLTRLLKASLTTKNRKVKLSVIRWMPMMYTGQYRVVVRAWQHSLFTFRLPLRYLTANADWGYMADILYLRLTNGAGGQGHFQSLSKRLLSQYMFYPGRTPDPRLYEGLWDPKVLSKNGRFWDPASFGEVDFFEKDGRDLSDYVARHKWDLYYTGFFAHQYLYNQLYLNFDPSLFDEFDKAIDDLAAVSEKVAVLYMDDFLQRGFPARPPEVRERLQARIDRLKQDSRFEFWDLSRDFEPDTEDFIDPVHMTKKGRDKLNQLLAEKIRARLLD